ncbi:MAG: hypothetical protein JNJ54_03775 [Myxococcaceae bacterium]|nr:hypothetical protein [Myxococcaceae bacterium]
MTVLLVAGLLLATPVEVVVTGCSLDAAKVRKLAELELHRGPDVPLPARLVCAAERFEVQVDDPLTNKTLVRALKTSDLIAAAPERFAALALVELAEASWSELLLPAPSVAVAHAPEAATRAAVEQLNRPRVRLGARGTARLFPQGPLALVGGGLVAHVRLVGPLGVLAEAGVETGSMRTSVGRISVDVLGAAGFVVAHVELGRVLLGGGAGFRAGAARLVGVPDDPGVREGRTLAATLGGPALLADAGLGLGPVDLSLQVEAGWAVWRLGGLSDGAALVSVGGLWLTASLGAGVRW